MNACCRTCREDQMAGAFPGVLTAAETARFVAAHPGMAVSLGGLVARVVWSATDQQAADGVAETVAARISTNAPGRGISSAGGARDITHACQEAQAMSHPIEPPHADTVQGRQMAAAIAVAKSLEHGLPDVTHWVITTDQAVRGMLKPTIDWLDRLHEWALFLAPVNGEPPLPHIKRRIGSPGADVEVTSTYRGVPFCIYHMASTGELKDLAASRNAS